MQLWKCSCCFSQADVDSTLGGLVHFQSGATFLHLSVFLSSDPFIFPHHACTPSSAPLSRHVKSLMHRCPSVADENKMQRQCLNGGHWRVWDLWDETWDELCGHVRLHGCRRLTYRRATSSLAGCRRTKNEWDSSSSLPQVLFAQRQKGND